MSRLAVRLLLAMGTFPLAACAVSPAADSASRPEPTSMTVNASPTPGASDVDSTAFARTLVATCAGVREGDMVLVSGAARDARLLEDVATEVRRLGAFPLVWLDSDRMRRMSYEAPEKFDAQQPLWRLELARNADVEIVVDGSETESLLADVPARRIAARERAGVAVTKRLIERGVRQVYVGNDLRPTADRAKRFGMSESALGRLYRAALEVDYDELQATGERIRAALEHPLVKKRTHADMVEVQRVNVRLTSPNGTDIRFDVAGRKAFVSDGVVSADDARRGGAALQTWLPAGEAFVSAVPWTADGRIVVDRDTWDGVEYRRLVLTFKGGRLESMTSESGGERLAAAYAAAGEGKDLFGGVDVGFNPALVAPEGTTLRSFAALGNVTVAFGANTWLGGENACDFGFTASLAGATLVAGDRTIVKDGELAR